MPNHIMEECNSSHQVRVKLSPSCFKCSYWPDDKDALGQLPGPFSQSMSFMIAIERSMLWKKKKHVVYLFKTEDNLETQILFCVKLSSLPWLDQNLADNICLCLSFHPVKKQE